ncbi:hypothetical protein [Candidatus Magnetobacterium casense]|uniref:Uncharacterized protein n=1 Tax=Candidatus Magnetobacterium casense TaxID=1455061 RepID=A0ABS6S0G0_9BACT|nr:hypothetical protein [Candidatus Magnetobacterium casensis]MBV6342349.1 hypothetical protein [Candidatus Magnetobacterium casensis]
MTSTQAGIKRFKEHYGEINPDTIARFLGVGREGKRELKRAWKARLEAIREGDKKLLDK